MAFEDIVGNAKVKTYLTHLIDSGRVPHLLLFSGIDGIGKKLIAQEFGYLWMQRLAPAVAFRKENRKWVHPDLHLLHVEGKVGLHSIQSIRRIKEQLGYTPFEGRGKVCIIDDAHRMLPSSANALLKLLEEPPEYSLIILITSEPEKLLETITSRAQRIRFAPLTHQELVQTLVVHHRKEEKVAHEMASHAHGSLQAALSTEKDEIEELLYTVLSQGGLFSFADIADTAAQLAHVFEEKRKTLESVCKKETLELVQEMTASQKNQLEQEMEGAIQSMWMKQCDIFFRNIYSFYRDLYLVGSNSCPEHLVHPERYEQLQAAYQQGVAAPLEKVESALLIAKKALERSSSMSTILEALFTKILK